MEAARHHSDDSARLLVERQRLADRVAAPGEAALPEVLADERLAILRRRRSLG
jgi:hypothetical protein